MKRKSDNAECLRREANEILGTSGRRMSASREIVRFCCRVSEESYSGQYWRSHGTVAEKVAEIATQTALGGAATRTLKGSGYWTAKILREIEPKVESLKVDIEFDDWAFTPCIHLEVSYRESESLGVFGAVFDYEIGLAVKELLRKCHDSGKPKGASYPYLEINEKFSGISLGLRFTSHVRRVEKTLGLSCMRVERGDEWLIAHVLASIEPKAVLLKELVEMGYERWYCEATEPEYDDAR